MFQQQQDWENAAQDYLTLLSNPERDQEADTQIKECMGEIYYQLGKVKHIK